MLAQLGSTVTALLCLAFLCGCGSTAALRQGQEISAAGTAYVTAVQAVADLTIDKAIERSTAGLQKQRASTWGAIDKAQLQDGVDKERKDLSQEIHEISIFKGHAQRLGAYFDALGKLVAEPAKDGYVAATKDLVDSAGALGTTLEKTNIVTSAHITEAQGTALGNLGGVIGDWYHAKAVRDVLNRDAKTIAAQIEIEQRALETFSGIVASTLTLEGEDMYRTRVLNPYVKGLPAAGAPRQQAPALPDTWTADFSTVVKASDLVAQVETARKAGKDFEQAWLEFTQGRWTTADVVGDLTRVRDSITAIQAVHENRH